MHDDLHLYHPYLQRHLVALDGLEGLRAADEGLDVVGSDLEDGGAVRDDAVEVGELLVAGGAVGEDLERQLRALVRELVQRLGVLLDGLFEDRGSCGRGNGCMSHEFRLGYGCMGHGFRSVRRFVRFFYTFRALQRTSSNLACLYSSSPSSFIFSVGFSPALRAFSSLSNSGCAFALSAASVELPNYNVWYVWGDGPVRTTTDQPRTVCM